MKNRITVRYKSHLPKWPPPRGSLVRDDESDSVYIVICSPETDTAFVSLATGIVYRFSNRQYTKLNLVGGAVTVEPQ